MLLPNKYLWTKYLVNDLRTKASTPSKYMRISFLYKQLKVHTSCVSAVNCALYRFLFVLLFFFSLGLLRSLLIPLFVSHSFININGVASKWQPLTVTYFWLISNLKLFSHCFPEVSSNSPPDVQNQFLKHWLQYPAELCKWDTEQILAKEDPFFPPVWVASSCAGQQSITSLEAGAEQPHCAAQHACTGG